MNKFQAMVGEDGYITYVPPELREAFEKRGFQDFELAGNVASIDRGGAVLVGAAQVDVTLDDTIVRVPVRDLEAYYDELTSNRARASGYWVLRGYFTAIVMTDAQRTQILDAWFQKLCSSRPIAAAEGKRFESAMQSIALHQVSTSELPN